MYSVESPAAGKNSGIVNQTLFTRGEFLVVTGQSAITPPYRSWAHRSETLAYGNTYLRADFPIVSEHVNQVLEMDY